MKKNKDFEILKSYAKALGIKVYRRGNDPNVHENGCFVYDTEDNSVGHIIVYRTDPETEVLTLLHECGHALDWLKNGKKFKDIDKKSDFEDEIRAIHGMIKVYEALPLSIKKWKVRAEMKFDKWINGYYLATNETPSYELSKKYRDKFLKQAEKNAKKF